MITQIGITAALIIFEVAMLYLGIKMILTEFIYDMSRRKDAANK